MEKEITLLIGLPGSGKSHWIKSNLSLAGKEGCRIAFDDISQNDVGLKKLTMALNNVDIQEIYIADVNFLLPEMIEKAQEKLRGLTPYPLKFNQVVFIGDHLTCQANVLLRNDGRNVAGTLSRFKNSLPGIIHRWKDDSKTTFINVQNYSIKKSNNIKKP